MGTTEAAKDKVEAEIIHRRLGEIGTLYADIWKVGVQLALRISDLLKIKFSDIHLHRDGYQYLDLIEVKTGKSRILKLNDGALEVIERRRADHPQDTWLFEVHTNRAKNKAISRQAVARAFQVVGQELNIRLNTHSMRKTRGRLLSEAGVPTKLICKLLNHRSEAETLLYLGITRQEVMDTYDFVI